MTDTRTTSGESQTKGHARHYEVTKADLPLHCPLDSMSLWNAHPRVFLPIEDSDGHAVCPYCGTEYTLK